jgi:potassium-dependent mechanosensitive channel
LGSIRYALTVLLWQDAPPQGWQRVWQYLHFVNSPVRFGKFEFTAVSLAQGLFVLLAAFGVSRFVRAFLDNRLSARKSLDDGLRFTLLRLTHYVLVTAGVLLAFNLAFGADFTSLAVVFTALSVGIGFGLQYIAGDIASGFILLFERPVRLGDFIIVTGPDGKLTEGHVRAIYLRTTVVVTNDRISVIVPNSKLVNQNLVNWSYYDRRSRIAVPVGVAYDSDVQLVTETLLRAPEGVEHVLTEPQPSVQFLGFGASALDFRLLVWTDRPRRYPQIKSDVNYRIWQLFKAAGIEIPFPQSDLRVRGGALDVTMRRDGAQPGDADTADGARPLQSTR